MAVAEPRYKQIAGDILALITAGTLRPGDAVPSERALATEYGVARETAADALRYLANQGLLVSGDGGPRRVARHQPLTVHLGRTADTAAPWELPSGGADSWVGDMRRAGYPPDQRIKVGSVPAGPEVAALLQVTEDTTVTERDLVRDAARRPHNRIKFWFPADLTAGTPLEREDSIGEGSLPWLEKHHGPLTHRPPWIRARMPTPDETGQLRIPAGVPVLVVRRVSRNPDRPVAASVAVYPADRTVLVP